VDTPYLALVSDSGDRDVLLVILSGEFVKFHREGGALLTGVS
jgi:hypothetical protein